MSTQEIEIFSSFSRTGRIDLKTRLDSIGPTIERRP